MTHAHSVQALERGRTSNNSFHLTGQVLSPPPPYLSQVSLVLSVIATFPGNESDLVQNITAELQSNPQAVLYALIASDGQVQITEAHECLPLLPVYS